MRIRRLSIQLREGCKNSLLLKILDLFLHVQLQALILASVSKALEMQYVQHKPGFLVVQIVENPVDPLMDSDIKQLVSDLDRKFEFFCINFSRNSGIYPQVSKPQKVNGKSGSRHRKIFRKLANKRMENFYEI